MMKKVILYLLFCIILPACSTTNSFSDKTFKDSLIGQNEIELFNLLGAPTRILFARDGEKIMVYESVSIGTFLTPNKSKISFDPNMPAFRSVDTRTNDKQFAIYPKEVKSFRLYLNKKGNCKRYEEINSNEQSEMYHQRFKHFEPENR